MSEAKERPVVEVETAITHVIVKLPIDVAMKTAFPLDIAAEIKKAVAKAESALAGEVQ